MKDTFKNQAGRTGIALAAAAVFAVLGIGTAQAQEFASAKISIEPRGEAAGGLTCSWRETGVGASQVVYYTCAAGAVGTLYACTYKGRVVYQSPTKLEVFKDVTGEHEAVPFLSQRNGQINGSTTTPIPVNEPPEGTPEFCTEPSVQEVVAVRWCDAALTDITNNIVGATAGELFQEFIPGVGTVPGCDVLLQ